MLAKPSAPAGSSAPVTDDCLLDGRVRLTQPAEGYRAAIDPVLLAAAVPARTGEHIFDLGSGVGSAALCLLARVPAVRVTCIEIQPNLADLARRNADHNQVSDRVSIIEQDVRDVCSNQGGLADHVMANPPFLPLKRAAPTHRMDYATVEVTATLAEWVSTALNLVRPKGSVTFIQRADRLDALLAALRPSAGGIIVCPLWPKAGVPAKRVLVRARKGVATPLSLTPGLILHGDDSTYTPEAEEILRHAAPLDLGALSQGR